MTSTTLTHIYALVQYDNYTRRSYKKAFLSKGASDPDMEVHDIYVENKLAIFNLIKEAIKSYIRENNITKYNPSDWVYQCTKAANVLSDGLDNPTVMELTQGIIQGCAQRLISIQKS